jgi:hypothetical protein
MKFVIADDFNMTKNVCVLWTKISIKYTKHDNSNFGFHIFLKKKIHKYPRSKLRLKGTLHNDMVQGDNYYIGQETSHLL